LKVGGEQQENDEDGEDEAGTQALEHLLQWHDLTPNCDGNFRRWAAEFFNGRRDLFGDSRGQRRRYWP
jgi:hypothetical protein